MAAAPPSKPAAAGRLIALTPLRAAVSRALQQRGQRLLQSDDPGPALQALAPLQAYYVFKELGATEAAPLLHHATAEQIRVLVDLDCWEEEQLQDGEVDAWLAPFAEAGPEALALAFAGLDLEVQALTLRHRLQIYPRHTETEPTVADADLDRGYWDTPDQMFTVVLRPQPEAAAEPFEVETLVLVQALYAADPEAARSLLLGTQHELDASLEEQARHFRQARLEDQGFVERPLAMQIFAPPRREPPLLGPPPEDMGIGLPAPLATALQDSSPLVDAWGGITDAGTLRRLETEFTALCNALLIAIGHSPRHVRGVMALAEQAAATVSCGLLSLLGQAEPAASRRPACQALLLRWPLRQLFAHGHRATAALRQQALALRAQPPAQAFLAAQLERAADAAAGDRAVFHALRRRLPREVPPPRDGILPPPRPFASPQQIDAAVQRLAALQQRLLG